MFSFYRLLEKIDERLSKVKDVHRQIVKDPEVTPTSSNKPQYQSKEVPSSEDEDTDKLEYNEEQIPEQAGVQNIDSYSMGDKTPNSPSKSLASSSGKGLINMSPYKGRRVKEKSQVSLP